MNKRRVMLFTHFERFWHWTQMSLILILLFTGFGIHGFHRLLDFDTAVTWHTDSALALLLLWVFAIFWHLTTGTWRHYVPTSDDCGGLRDFTPTGFSKENVTLTVKPTGESTTRFRHWPIWDSSCSFSLRSGSAASSIFCMPAGGPLHPVNPHYWPLIQ